ncbi:MAG: guanylate kinase [Sorangium cellulosum]|nr:MAG: guanylate kinase [Sorangium cellulosum]
MSNDELQRTVNHDFLLLILSSPSGAGKSTLSGKLRERFPKLCFSVSHTTRAPRTNEQDGREYHFIDRACFEAMVKQGAFVEWAEVHGNLYGTSIEEIESARNKHEGVLFDVDYQGARQIRSCYPEAVTVFILPPSLDELERRLRRRASDSEASITRRLAAALGEIEHYGFFDYVVVNDQLQEAAEQLRGIVMAERCRRGRRARMAEGMLREVHKR